MKHPHLVRSWRGWAAAAALAAALTPGAAQAVPVVYFESVAPATYYPDIRVGLGNLVFGNESVTVLNFTFAGDTDDVRAYQVNNTYGYIIDRGVATVEIIDASDSSRTVSATFDPGEIYVGTDIPGAGLGFGSRVYPIYPYALLAPGTTNLANPLYDLRQDFSINSFAISCVGYASGPCRNVAPFGPNFPLHTDKGDFWVTSQGITRAYFGVTTSVPEPATLALLLAGLGAIAFRRGRDEQHG